MIIHAYNPHVRLVPPEPLFVEQPKLTQVEEPTLLWNQYTSLGLHMSGLRLNQGLVRKLREDTDFACDISLKNCTAKLNSLSKAFNNHAADQTGNDESAKAPNRTTQKLTTASKTRVGSVHPALNM